MHPIFDKFLTSPWFCRESPELEAETRLLFRRKLCGSANVSVEICDENATLQQDNTHDSQETHEQSVAVTRMKLNGAHYNYTVALTLVFVVFSGSIVHMQDLESTLVHVFRHEVATCKTIDGEKMLALQKLVRVLVLVSPSHFVSSLLYSI